MLISRLFSVSRRALLGLIPFAILAPESRAQSTLPITADTRMVAGWDFEFTPTANYGPPVSGVLAANYSDLYPPQTGVNDGPPSALRGTMYMNGTNGSDLWTFTGPLASATKRADLGDEEHQILSRGGGSTELGGYGGLDSAALGNNRTTGARSKIAYVLNTEGLTAMVGVNYRTRMQADGVTASIDWSLVVGATTFDLEGPITVSGTVFVTKEFPLAAVNLGGATSVTLIATVDNPSTSNVMVVDNLSIYGTPVGAGAAPVITSALTTSGMVGTPFTYTIAANNTPTSFGATGLPAWAAINTTTGAITGTPNAAGVTAVTISATNGSGTGNAQLQISIDPALPVAPVINSATTATGNVGSSFTYTITGTNTPTSFAATGLPSWASINATTGAITGTPDAAGVTAFSIFATNAGGTGNGQVQITIDPALPAPVINSATTASGFVGSSFSYTISATNSPASFGATGLPGWASVNTTTGVISGTPTAAAVTVVNLSATNGGGTGTGQVTITIATPVVPVPPSTPVGGATAYNAFTAQWSAVTGATGYRLDVATDAGFTQFVTGFQNLDVGNVTSKEVTGLPLDTYYFQVRAYNTEGTSMSSSASSIEVGSRLLNLSTRGQTSAASPMIAGFFVADAPKTVLIRAAAKVLADLGVAGTVANPRLRLVNATTGVDLASNDNWNATDPVVIDAVQKSGAGLVFTPGSVDAVIVAQNLPPGGYTAIVETVTGAAGIVLVELYEIDSVGRLTNMSTRGVTVEAGADVMIPGTFFGPTSKRLLIRVVGQTLANFIDPATVLLDPVLEIYNQDAPATPLFVNDNWDINDAALKSTWTDGDPNRVAGLSFAPAGTTDAALLVVLPKNNQGYTVIARGKNGATGNVLVEIYEAK